MLIAADHYSHEKWLALLWTGIAILIALLLPRLGRRRGASPPPLLGVLMGKDKRLSTSKTVAAAWTVVVTYILFALITLWPPDWSQPLKHFDGTYLGFLGGPFAALVLAKAAVSTRTATGSLAKPPADDDSLRLSDLVNDDTGQPDLFDLQYVLFNGIAIVFVIVAFLKATADGFPEIPQAILLLTCAPATVYVSNKFFGSDAPTIFSLIPSTVRVGESFTVTGQNLTRTGDAAPIVTVGVKEATPVSAWTSTSITATAPDLGADLDRPVGVSIKTPAGVQSYLDSALRVLATTPELFGADRGAAYVGDLVTLRGRWLASQDAGLAVTLDDAVAAEVRSPGNDKLSFLVPPLANLDGTRAVTVKVRSAGQESNPITLDVSGSLTSQRQPGNGQAGHSGAKRSLLPHIQA